MSPKQSVIPKALGISFFLALVAGGSGVLWAQPASSPVVVVLKLDQMVHHVSAGYVVRGIKHANEIGASAVLLELDTPGGLQNSMRWIIQSILDSRIPVITYVTPSGGGAASAGFFILLAGDLAVMAPGTTTGAAHPVIIGGVNLGKTMEAKIENDAAAYIRSIADKRGRNAKLAEEGVRASRSFTEKEALEGKLIDGLAATSQDIFANFDGKSVRRVDDTTTALRLSRARLEPYTMGRRERFFAWIADPNVAFLLGAIGLACLYIEFTHPGLVAPGVVGAVMLVMAMYAFNLLPINTLGILLIILALVLFVLEANITSHGALAAGGVVAMVIGAMILVDSPWPEARIQLSTALSVALPLAIITVILLRFAIAAQRSKAVTGLQGMLDATGVAQTDLDPKGKVMVRGEIWDARASAAILKGVRIRVRGLDGLTLLVETKPDSG
ncbi:MAG: nodulation protein NfeD [Acidobacteria bacterium]|nr:nodulation protein NfeD [Acidobacteriota bacterium]